MSSVTINQGTVEVSIVSGVSKKTQKEWKAILVKIGDWSTLVFPKSKFETEYIQKILDKN